MKKNILLLDPSVTVQKVVALTLDRSSYQIHFAKTRSDAMKVIADQVPDLILLSDQVLEVDPTEFPKEVESWIGRLKTVPPMVLLTAKQEAVSASLQKTYATVLKKPFSPQMLRDAVNQFLPAERNYDMEAVKEVFEDVKDEQHFNEAFHDETYLVKKTLEGKPPKGKILFPEKAAASAAGIWDLPEQPEPPRKPPLWSAQSKKEELKMEYAPIDETEVEKSIENQDLPRLINDALNRMVPPIVEKLVKERLDALLQEQEQYTDLKA